MGQVGGHGVSLWNFYGSTQDKCKSEHNHSLWTLYSNDVHQQEVYYQHHSKQYFVIFQYVSHEYGQQKAGLNKKESNQ